MGTNFPSQLALAGDYICYGASQHSYPLKKSFVLLVFSACGGCPFRRSAQSENKRSKQGKTSMPIVRVDIPDWATKTEMANLKKELHGCIERTWAREHIWIAVRHMCTEEGGSTVILTVDLRDGRGQEKERTQALFDETLRVCNRLFGTTEDKLIVLVRKFRQDECVSGGGELPPLVELTPVLQQPQRKLSA
jgi:hypothetical protein